MSKDLMPRVFGIEYFRDDDRVWDIIPIPDDYEEGKRALERWESCLSMGDHSDKFTAYLYERSETRVNIKDRWLYSACCWKSKLGHNSQKIFILKAKGQIVSLEKKPRYYSNDKVEWSLTIMEGKDKILVDVSQETITAYEKLIAGFREHDTD